MCSVKRVKLLQQALNKALIRVMLKRISELFCQYRGIEPTVPRKFITNKPSQVKCNH